MSQTLKINNFGSANILESTMLDAEAPVNSAILVLQNSNGLAANNYVILGTLGSENSELRTILSVDSATGIHVTVNTGLEHPVYEPLTKLFGNRLRVYRAANVNGYPPADASFAKIAEVDIDADQLSTTYIDTSGSENYWYKSTYYNLYGDAESNLADSKAVRGGGQTDYCSIEDIREQSGFKYARYISDALIDQKRQAAQGEINSALVGSYQIPFQSPINPVIQDICVRLASGLLLVHQYSAVNSANNAAGQKKIDDARAELKELGMKQNVLTDETGLPIDLPGGSGGVTSWPDATTATTPTENGGAPRVFRMGDIQGYRSRRY